MIRRIIINIDHDSLTDEQAVALVAQVIDARARVIRQRIESFQSPALYIHRPYSQSGMLFAL